MFFYSEAELVQPTYSMGHDLLQKLLMLALDAPCQGKHGQLHPALIEELPTAHPGEQRYPTTPAQSLGLCMEEQDSFPHPYPEKATPTVWFPETVAIFDKDSSKKPKWVKWPLLS